MEKWLPEAKLLARYLRNDWHYISEMTGSPSRFSANLGEKQDNLLLSRDANLLAFTGKFYAPIQCRL